jgi:AcrR family transcriptional regulator
MASNDDVSAQLLEAARSIIRARGYVGVSVKGAATAAGIAPEVAMRYYKDRDELFAAVMKLPFDPAAAVPTLLAPGIEGMGERLVMLTLNTLGDPAAREELIKLLQAGASAGKAADGLIDFIENSVIDRVTNAIGVPDARMRTALIASQLVGMAVIRFGVRLEPLASASEDEVVRMLAPGIQVLLDPRNPIVGYDYEARGQVRPSETTAAQAAVAAKDAAAQGAKSGMDAAAAAVNVGYLATEVVIHGAKEAATAAMGLVTSASRPSESVTDPQDQAESDDQQDPSAT